MCGGEFRGKKKHQDHETMGNGASDSCCGLWVVDDRKTIERADRLHKSELYACRAWVPYVRHVERLLKKKRVAPFERGVCFLSPPGFVECPICFLVWKDTITATLTTTSHLQPASNAKLTRASAHRAIATSTGHAAATSQSAQVCAHTNRQERDQ